MQEQKSRQQLGQTSSFSSNALGEIGHSFGVNKDLEEVRDEK
jgi:hypothetical protein